MSSALSREYPLLATIVMGEFSFEVTSGDKMLCASNELHGLSVEGKDWNELMGNIVDAIYCHKGREYKVGAFNYIRGRARGYDANRNQARCKKDCGIRNDCIVEVCRRGIGEWDGIDIYDGVDTRIDKWLRSIQHTITDISLISPALFRLAPP